MGRSRREDQKRFYRSHKHQCVRPIGLPQGNSSMIPFLSNMFDKPIVRRKLQARDQPTFSPGLMKSGFDKRIALWVTTIPPGSRIAAIRSERRAARPAAYEARARLPPPAWPLTGYFSFPSIPIYQSIRFIRGLSAAVCRISRSPHAFPLDQRPGKHHAFLGAAGYHPQKLGGGFPAKGVLGM